MFKLSSYDVRSKKKLKKNHCILCYIGSLCDYVDIVFDNFAI